MRIPSRIWLPVILLCSCAPRAVAATVTIGFDPTGQAIPVGGSTLVRVTVADLVDFTPPALGAFDLNVTFDAAILSVQDVAFGPFLGGTAEAILSSTVTAGMVRLTGVSLLSPTELVALQPDSFTLATMNVGVSALGPSPLILTVNSVSDEIGFAITLVKTETGEVTGIPEPGTLDLVTGGALTLLASRMLRRRLAR